MAIFRAHSLQGWIAEVVAIALGVGLAIAAEDWNEHRSERNLEQQFLLGIALDMELSINSIEGSKAQGEEILGSLERMRSALITGSNDWERAEEFVRDLVYCTYLGIPNLTSITFEELRSTGSLRLLRDSTLKRELAEFYTYFDQSSQFHPEYRRKEAALEEALLGFLPLSERLEINSSGLNQSTTVNVEATLARLREQPELIARIEDMIWVQHRITTRYDGYIVTAENILKSIEYNAGL